MKSVIIAVLFYIVLILIFSPVKDILDLFTHYDPQPYDFGGKNMPPALIVSFFIATSLGFISLFLKKRMKIPIIIALSTIIIFWIIAKIIEYKKFGFIHFGY